MQSAPLCPRPRTPPRPCCNADFVTMHCNGEEVGSDEDYDEKDSEGGVE